MSTYSFLSIQATIDGPGGNFSLAASAQAAEEGITVSMADDKNTLTLGAGGEGMHNLHAGKSGTITARFLKTSPANQQLSQMYNLQTANASLHGINQISIRDSARGDVISCSGVAFKKLPDIGYAKDGAMVEWAFDAITIDMILGSGAPSRV